MDITTYDKINEMLSTFAKRKLSEQERIKKIIESFCKVYHTQFNKTLDAIVKEVKDSYIPFAIQEDYYKYCNNKDCDDCEYNEGALQCKIAFTYDWLNDNKNKNKKQ